jgi:hypothetical protein
MLKRLAGLGLFATLLCVPLQADHKRHRSHYREGYYPARGYVEVYVGTPYGHGAFVRGYRPVPYGYSRYSHDHYYGEGRREYRKFKYKRRHYFKRHRHDHYDGRCPY